MPSLDLVVRITDSCLHKIFYDIVLHNPIKWTVVLCCVITWLGVIIIIRGREILGEGVRVAMGNGGVYLFFVRDAQRRLCKVIKSSLVPVCVVYEDAARLK